jgi:molybdopterin-binding protein
MHEFKMSDAAAIIGVSADTVRRLADAGTLKTRRTRGGHRLVEGRSLAAYVAKQVGPVLRDVSSEQSMRNRLPGIVTRVVKDKVAAQVEIQIGPHRMVSLLTREAVEALGLEPGMMAIATVKSTNVSVEVPPSASRARRTA